MHTPPGLSLGDLISKLTWEYVAPESGRGTPRAASPQVKVEQDNGGAGLSSVGHRGYEERNNLGEGPIGYAVDSSGPFGFQMRHPETQAWSIT